VALNADEWVQLSSSSDRKPFLEDNQENALYEFSGFPQKEAKKRENDAF